MYKVGAILFVVAVVAAAVLQAPVIAYAGAIAVPAVAFAGLGMIVSQPALTDASMKVAAVAIGFGVAAESLGGALRLVVQSPGFALAVGAGVVLTFVAAMLRVLLYASSVRVEPPRPIRRAPVRERLPIVEPRVGGFGATPPPPVRRDELDLFGRDE